jgi:leucyl aminopeptidase
VIKCQRFLFNLGKNHVILQVLNTDAEGRLTLADALVYAEKNCQAEAIIDVATLTGACMVALGTSMCGMFSPNQQLVSQLKQAGSKSGDHPSCSHAEARFLRSVVL